MSAKECPLTSSELATMWVVYQKKTMMVCVINYFLAKAEEDETKQLFQQFVDTEKQYVKELAGIFKREGAVVPIAHDESDVREDVPRLFDSIYDVMYLRLMMKIAMGLHALHLSMTYREDMIKLYKKFFDTAEESYFKATMWLAKKGVLVKPPHVSMPKKVEFAKDTDYLSGLNPFKKKRSFNTIEVAYLYAAIESNSIGMQMMIGYAQAAKDKDVANYFISGIELSKKIISDITNILLASDIQTPISWSGFATDSTIPPFSDKLMMYNTALITSFSLGSGALGSSFSLRGDLPVKMALIGQNIFDFAKEGGKIMASKGWMEEPPQMEDRNKLIKLE